MTSWQFTPYWIPLIATGGLAITIAIFIWHKRKVPGGISFSLLMFSLAIWTLAYALEMSAGVLSGKIFFAKIEYIGIVTIPLAWFTFVLEYTGREDWLSKRNLAILASIPIITLFMVWTNELHHLHWLTNTLDHSEGFSVLISTYGPWFWIHTLISYLYLLSGTILLIQWMLGSPEIYRGQAVFLLMAAFLPWVGNAIYISGLSPWTQLDLTPFSFSIAGLIIAWNLYRFHFLDIIPIARDSVFANMEDGVIVLDPKNRVVDINPSVEGILGIARSELFTKSIEGILKNLSISPMIEGRNRYEFPLERQGELKYIETLISEVHDRRGRFRGRLILLHDITERKLAEHAIQHEQQISSMRSKQLETVALIAKEAAAIHDLNELLNQSTHLICTHFSYNHVGIYLLDDADEFAVLQAASGEAGNHNLTDHDRLRVDQSNLIGYVAAHQKPSIAQELVDIGVDSSSTDFPDMRSEIALPLIARNRVIGVIDVQSKLPSAFNQDDVDVLQILADQIALTIESAHLLEQTQQAVNELEALYREEVIHAWQKQIRDIPMGYHYNRVQVKPLNSDELKRSYPYGVQKAGLVSNENGHHLSVPITLRGQKIGSIALRREKDQPAWNSTELAFAEEAVTQISASLENARLLDQTRRRAERERLVTEITTRMRSTTDPQTILQIAVQELQQALNAERVQISFPSIQERSNGDEHVE